MVNETALNTAGSVPTFLGMHPDVAAIWVSIGIAFAQLLVAGYWLWRWKKDNDELYRQLEQQAIDSERHHEEAMQVLQGREQEWAEQDHQLDAQLAAFRLVTQRFASTLPSES